MTMESLFVVMSREYFLTFDAQTAALKLKLPFLQVDGRSGPRRPHLRLRLQQIQCYHYLPGF